MEKNRIEALDGLRGVAALTVVFLHVALVTTHPTGTVWWILNTTPLGIVRAGVAAVWVFFVLSGYVLSRRHFAGTRLVPRSYYPRRAVRLYLPVLASAVIALAARVVPHRAFADSSGFVSSHVPTPRLVPVLRSLSLLTDTDKSLNGPWWSLRWEVLFSILLPLVIFLALRLRRYLAVLGIMCVCVSAVANVYMLGHINAFVSGAVAYLPMFGIGVALAGYEARISGASGMSGV